MVQWLYFVRKLYDCFTTIGVHQKSIRVSFRTLARKWDFDEHQLYFRTYGHFALMAVFEPTLGEIRLGNQHLDNVGSKNRRKCGMSAFTAYFMVTMWYF